MDVTYSWIDSDGERDYRIDCINIKEMIEGSGTGNLMNIDVMDWILDADIDEFDSCEDVCIRNERNTGNTCENNPNFDQKGNSLRCPMCEFVGKDFQRTRAHFKTHDTDILVKTILTNRCPVCDKTFTDTMCARQHGKSLQTNKECPAQHRTGSNKFGPNSVKQIEEHTCGICKQKNLGTLKSKNIVTHSRLCRRFGSSRF